MHRTDATIQLNVFIVRILSARVSFLHWLAAVLLCFTAGVNRKRLRPSISSQALIKGTHSKGHSIAQGLLYAHAQVTLATATHITVSSARGRIGILSVCLNYDTPVELLAHQPFPSCLHSPFWFEKLLHSLQWP